MSDKKGWGRKTCGNCGRVSRKDLGRGYCPTTACRISHGKPADDCVFYIRDDGGNRRRRDVDVFEE